MKTIWMVKVPSHLGGDEWYYAGADTETEALALAYEHGHHGDNIEAKEIPNRFGIQRGEFRSAV